MNNKVQELADKLYQEGVEKGNNEAEIIIAKANEKAAAIIEKAKEDAQAITLQAEKDSRELEENTKSELKMFAAQAVNALKSEITNVISKKVTTAPVKEFASKKDFLPQFIVAMASKWSAEEAVVISTSEAKQLTAYFEANAKELLNKKVEIKEVNGIDCLFTIGPADGSYKVNFGETEFTSYFEAFLRPQLVEMLFDK